MFLHKKSKDKLIIDELTDHLHNMVNRQHNSFYDFYKLFRLIKKPNRKLNYFIHLKMDGNNENYLFNLLETKQYLFKTELLVNEAYEYYKQNEINKIINVFTS